MAGAAQATSRAVPRTKVIALLIRTIPSLTRCSRGFSQPMGNRKQQYNELYRAHRARPLEITVVFWPESALNSPEGHGRSVRYLTQTTGRPEPHRRPTAGHRPEFTRRSEG